MGSWRSLERRSLTRITRKRACYAALNLRHAVRVRHGIPFGVRIGLNSGEVVVGRIGDDLRLRDRLPFRLVEVGSLGAPDTAGTGDESGDLLRLVPALPGVEG
jgi:hypothetical protein